MGPPHFLYFYTDIFNGVLCFEELLNSTLVEFTMFSFFTVADVLLKVCNSGNPPSLVPLYSEA